MCGCTLCLVYGGVSVALVELVSVRVCVVPASSFCADLMGVAHFLSDRRLRPDWPPELGGVGVDCTEPAVCLTPADMSSRQSYIVTLTY